jgi:hypothetical protein
MTGETSTFEKRCFCPVCGSRLFFFLDNAVEVFLGTLDEAPYSISPIVEVWNIRREPWLPPVNGAVLYDKNEFEGQDGRSKMASGMLWDRSDNPGGGARK